MSQLNTFLERIANIQVNISVPGLGRPQVLAANPYQPSDVSSLQCPFWVNELRGGPSNLPIANGQQLRTTSVHMFLAVVRREGNVDLKYSVQQTAEWVDAVYAAFAQHIKLSAPAVNILSSTNASPIKITTATPHGLNPAGDQVTIAGHLVNTNANGVWNATILDYVNFTIPAVGNGVGGATGTSRPTQPLDMANISDVVITSWDLVPFTYGSTDQGMPNFLALEFILRVREIYVQPMSV